MNFNAFFQGIGGRLRSFVEQSQRVIAITHKPRQPEYKQMALTTAIGMALIGIVGFVISMVSFFIKNH